MPDGQADAPREERHGRDCDVRRPVAQHGVDLGQRTGQDGLPLAGTHVEGREGGAVGHVQLVDAVAPGVCGRDFYATVEHGVNLGAGSRVQGAGFRVQGAGCRV